MSKDAEIYAHSIIELVEMIEFVIDKLDETKKINYQETFKDQEMSFMAYINNNNGPYNLMRELLADTKFFATGLVNLSKK